MKPLGYWLIHIHELLENGFERLLADEGLTRRHWQLLNTIAERPSTMAELNEALAPFGADFQPQVDDLVERGWAFGSYDLTDPGRAAYHRVSARVQAFRAKVVEDVDYATLMNLLERVATNAAAAV